MANRSAERDFSKLVHVKKNVYRTNSLQENLTNFMVLCSKNIILDVIKINEILKEFIFKKTKENCFYLKTIELYIFLHLKYFYLFYLYLFVDDQYFNYV